MTNYSLIMMITVMFSVNVGLALFDGAVSSYSSENMLLNSSSSPLATISFGGDFFDGVNLSTALTLPIISESVDTSSGASYSDTTKTANNWLKKLDSTIGFIKSMVSQPAKMLRDFGVPKAYTFAFQLLWWVIFLFLSVSFVKGSGAD